MDEGAEDSEEEASDEGEDPAGAAPRAASSLSAAEARRQAEAEGLILVASSTGALIELNAHDESVDSCLTEASRSFQAAPDSGMSRLYTVDSSRAITTATPSSPRALAALIRPKKRR